MSNTSRLWKVLGTLLIVSFSILLYMGREIYLAAPPIPVVVKSTGGETLFTREEYNTGREVWQRVGGHEMGSIWGHGSYVAPDWTADWLHREATALLDIVSQREAGKAYVDLDGAQQAALQQKLAAAMRANTYDAATGVLTVSADRAQAIKQVADHYDRLFGPDPSLDTLRSQYAIQQNPVPDANYRRAMNAFIFWSSWAAVTQRPNSTVTYTSNWPSDPLVGNVPTTATFLWTFVSILGLLAGVGALAWYYVATHGKEPAPRIPDHDPLGSLQPTPSMKATREILLGGHGADRRADAARRHHGALRGRGPEFLRHSAGADTALLGDPQLARAARGAVDRHRLARHRPVHRARDLGERTQIPAAGSELPVHLPAGDRGRCARRPVGAVMQKMGLERNFWFGHQGYEYVDIGRFWQAFLFVGLMLWLRSSDAPCGPR